MGTSTHLTHLGQQRGRILGTTSPSLATPEVAKSEVLRQIASGSASTRAELTQATGIARTTLAKLLGALIDEGHIEIEIPHEKMSGKGRPAESYRIADSMGVILAAAASTHTLEMAVMTPNQNCLCYRNVDIDIKEGPITILGVLTDEFDTMLGELGSPQVLTVAIGLPGPVDFATGTPIRPPIMPGWDRYPVASHLTQHFGCKAVVDNDVNLMALGESRSIPATQLPLVYVMVGEGVGSGMVYETGTVHRGAHGAAGDLGHIRVAGDSDQICTCGNIGCLEAVASEHAMARRWAELTGQQQIDVNSFEQAIVAGDPMATRVLRDAVETIGVAVATLVNVYNPARISLGGPLTLLSDDLLSGVRSVVYSRALPLATNSLVLEHPNLGEESGIIGATLAGIDAWLAYDTRYR